MSADRSKLVKVKLRIAAVALIYLGLFVVMAARGYQLHLFNGDELGKRAERQLTKKISFPPVRGKILDRNGVELATNRDVASIYAQPSRISDTTAVAKALSKIIGVDAKSVRKKLALKTSFVWIKRSLSVEQGDIITALDIEGVGVIKETRRYYPNMELASHLLGFAGVDSQGLEGIELKYDDYIKGTSGYFLAERDALGRNIYPKGVNIKDSSSGSDVILTIDRTVQHITERELGAAVKKFDAKFVIAIVMDPKTVEVLSMAVQPVFNPNSFEDFNPSDWRNRVLTDTFEPGSTFKIFLAAAAIDSGRVDTKELFYCENGRVKVYNKYIHDTKKYGWLTMQNILRVSSNIGAYKIGAKVGKDVYYRYISGFGFGEKTGIALPGEASGRLRSSKSLSPVGYANLAFGQGISVTALQLVTAISAVANGGHIMKPYVVKKIVDRDGTIQLSNYPLRVRRVISDDTAKKVSLMLERVVSSEGTGMRGSLEKYRVAGKTGTSQKYDIKLKEYSREKYTGSFVGFLPADNPKLAILVMLDEPKKSYYGGTVAAPVFKKIAEQTLAYMKVTPVEEGSSSASYRQAAAEANPVTSMTRVLRTPAGGKLGTMPDLKGLTLREILVSMGSSPSRIKGSGVVVQQFPLSGRPIKKGDPYRIKLGALLL